MPGLPCRGYQRFDTRLNRWACTGRAARLYSPRLEKRSQALQACNLTRNIQADGTPMVRPTSGESNLLRSFLSPSDTGVMPWKRTGIKSQTSVRSLFGFGRFLFGSRAIASPMHLSGTLPGKVHKDYRA